MLQPPSNNFNNLNNPKFNDLFKPIIPPIPKIRLNNKRKGIKTKVRKQPTRYTPSFTSLALNIRTKFLPKTYKLGLGGLSIRPIVVKKKETRKKVKKKKKRGNKK